MTNALVVALILLGGVLARLPAQSPCPLRVDAVAPYGIALRVTLHSKADYAVRHVVLHVTFADGLQQYHERTYRFDMLVQPRQAVTLATPPITDAVVKWNTVSASATCRAVTDEDDS